MREIYNNKVTRRPVDYICLFFFSSRRRHTRFDCDWSSDVCSSDLAKGALNSLFLGLGAVSLLVGAVGVGNVMLIGVLERRSEIGLRRALGATRGHIQIGRASCRERV